jgi:hypothetical protein
VLRQSRVIAGALALACVLAGCSSGGGGGGSGAAPAAAAPVATAPASGAFDMLTYNVAGLPQFVSQVQPSVNMPLISPLLNGYDLVLVQEDFWYHTELAKDALHPYQSTPKIATVRAVADGLNQFSRLPFPPIIEREMWAQCYGLINHANDCLSEKGFSLSRVTLTAGVEVDIYNLHADAGSAYEDNFTRARQFEQLRDFILARSNDRAVLVAGDYNLTGFDPEDEPVLQAFMSALGLTDSCRFLLCGDEHIDRILFRETPGLEIRPITWRIATEFVDAAGAPLSDHDAVHVRFEWVAR